MAKNWVKKMITEHALAVVALNKAEKFLNNAVNDSKTNKATVANMALVVRDLRNLVKDYQVMLNNEGIEFTPDGGYYERVAVIRDGKAENINNNN
jgi:hypothetical protein